MFATTKNPADTSWVEWVDNLTSHHNVCGSYRRVSVFYRICLHDSKPQIARINRCL